MDGRQIGTEKKVHVRMGDRNDKCGRAVGIWT